MNTVLTLSSKNQLTLPVTLVDLLGLTKGAKMWTKLVGNTITIEKIETSWDSLQGTLKGNSFTENHPIEEVVELAKEKEAIRLMKKHAA
jgi:hypothetical protein